MIINFSPQNKYPKNNLEDTQINSKQEHPPPPPPPPPTTTTTTTTATTTTTTTTTTTSHWDQKSPPFRWVKPSHVARRLVQWWPCLPTRRRSWRRWKWPPMGWGWGRVSLFKWMWLNECLFYMLCYVFGCVGWWLMMVGFCWGRGMDEGSWCMWGTSVYGAFIYSTYILWFSSKGSNHKCYIQIYCRDTIYTPLKNKNANPEKNEPWPRMCEKRTHNKHQHHQH